MRDYSGGQMTNWGAHHFGGALYALGRDETGPVEVHPPRQGRPITFVFADGLRMYKAPGPGRGPIVYRGQRGTAPGPDQPPPARPGPMRLYSGRRGIGGDFLHCVRTRQRPFRDVEYAHRTATVCHLGNIAEWLGRSLRWDPAAERFLDDEQANRMLDRPRREPWRL
jgi:hypothetical protein